MSNIPYKDANGNTRYLKNATAGTDADPDKSPIETLVDGVETLLTSISTTGIKTDPYTLVDRSGTTAATIGNKTQLAAANTSRQQLTIENRSATDTLTLWVGASGAEVSLPGGVLLPGTIGDYRFFQTSSSDRYAISSSGASTAYIASEGVWS